MLFAYESKRRYLAGEPRLRVLCGPEVEHKLKTHRLDEMLSMCTPVSEIAFSGAPLVTASRVDNVNTRQESELRRLGKSEEERVLI